MSCILRISEAAAIALHAAVLLAQNPCTLIQSRRIASILKVSEAHLSKVLLRLEKAGMVRSVRGPKGGYTLAKSGDTLTLLDIYEAIDGPLLLNNCILKNRICNGSSCIMGEVLKILNREFRNYISKTSLNNAFITYQNRECGTLGSCVSF